MADAFVLSGGYTVTPVPAGAGDWLASATFDERMTLKAKQAGVMELSVDGPTPLPFAGVAKAHSLVLNITGGKVLVSLLYAGAPGGGATAQIIPVEGLLALTSYSDPITEIIFTRAPGVVSSVRFFLGERE